MATIVTDTQSAPATVTDLTASMVECILGAMLSEGDAKAALQDLVAGFDVQVGASVLVCGPYGWELEGPQADVEYIVDVSGI